VGHNSPTELQKLDFFLVCSCCGQLSKSPADIHTCLLFQQKHDRAGGKEGGGEDGDCGSGGGAGDDHVLLVDVTFPDCTSFVCLFVCLFVLTALLLLLWHSPAEHRGSPRHSICDYTLTNAFRRVRGLCVCVTVLYYRSTWAATYHLQSIYISIS